MIALLYQGNQVAIKKIKNHLKCNFQKPSIVTEFNLVTKTFLYFCSWIHIQWMSSCLSTWGTITNWCVWL